MKSRHNSTTRRAFFVRGGATLGAGVATAAGAAPIAPSPAGITAGSGEREAIRSLHAAFIADVEQRRRAGAHPSHLAYRGNASQRHDVIQVSDDGRQASAIWHVDVKLGMPLEGDCTAAQMARLQGMLAGVRWETGRLHVDYVKAQGAWELASVRFETA